MNSHGIKIYILKLLFFLIGERDKKLCIKALLSEQRDLSLQAAGHSLSAVHLKQRIFVYHRYLIALARSQKSSSTSSSATVKNPTSITSLRKQAIQNEHIKKLELQVITNRKILKFQLVFRAIHLL